MEEIELLHLLTLASAIGSDFVSSNVIRDVRSANVCDRLFSNESCFGPHYGDVGKPFAVSPPARLEVF